MQLKHVIYILTVFILICGGIFVRGVLTLQVVILKNGEEIEVDNAWDSGFTFFYEKDGEMHYIDSDEVSRLLIGDLNKPKDLLPCAIFQLRATLKEIGQIFQDRQPGDYVIWSALLFALVIFVVLIGTIIKKVSAGARNLDSAEARTTMPLAKAKSVEQFFLNVYRRQVEAAPEDSARIIRVSGQPADSNRVYELQIQLEDELKKRRMTIGPLGETSGSKSQCYSVIYDTHIVLKVPPVPINDFDDYIRRIRNEAHIVKKLAPKECIIPNVSVILRAIHTFRDVKFLSPDELEYKYIHWLQVHPEYQDYLKIDESFIFFMDLSKYYFLSHVMDGLHGYQKEIEKEIVHDAAIIRDIGQFTEKYGPRNENAGEKLHKLYDHFDQNIQKLLSRSDVENPPGEKQKQEWFVTHLTGGVIDDKGFGHSKAFLSEIKTLLHRIFDRNQPLVSAYRKITTQYLRHIAFGRNRATMEGLITNLLDLLEWLGKCEVAMRDLKPDNLLVAGNPDNYPKFLSFPEEYSIGLIDVEISVDYHPDRSHQSIQPQLAGTPLFATPTHFFKNAILFDVYGDLKPVFHLQDWHAMVAIIYEVVTGEHLFPTTAARFPGMVEQYQKVVRAEGNASNAFKMINIMYWISASEEFNAHILENEKWFKVLNVMLPDGIKTRLKRFAIDQKQKIIRQIDMHIKKQKVFKGAENCKRLRQYTYNDVIRFKIKYEKSDGAKKHSRIVRSKIIQLLDKLAELKQRSQHLTENIAKLKKPDSYLPVKDLLELMFGVIHHDLRTAVRDSRLELKIEKMIKRKPAIMKKMPKDYKGLEYTSTFG